MTFSEFQGRLNTKNTDIFIVWNDTPTIKKALILLYEYNYNFVCQDNLNTAQTCEQLKEDMEKRFYRSAHGNAKPILHIFYNSITGKNDIEFTALTYLRTYPQYKNTKIHSLF